MFIKTKNKICAFGAYSRAAFIPDWASRSHRRQSEIVALLYAVRHKKLTRKVHLVNLNLNSHEERNGKIYPKNYGLQA